MRGRKRGRLARYDLIPVKPLWMVAEVYGIGASKYESRNWELGYEYSQAYAALQRHLQQYWGGEDYDVGGQHHLASVIFHCMSLMEWAETHPEHDDRPRKVELESEVTYDPATVTKPWRIV